MSIQPVFLMSDIFPFSAILDFLRDILMQAWLCLAVVLRPIVGDTIVDAFPFIMGGTLVTVGSVALALGMGLVLGVPMAVLQVYGNALARRLVGLYVWFFRGVPILVLLFLSQGLFLSMGWILEPFLLSCLVMGCISTAYQSQIFRGAIESLPQGQLKAARALGMRDLTAITGQKAIITNAKKSVANFKLREGMPVGAKVTLRGDKMWEFLDRLFNVALPRVRDFRGISANAFDGRGNYALGIKEQLIFPEIEYDKIDKIRGMDIVICTTAQTDEEARELLTLVGAPFER